MAVKCIECGYENTPQYRFCGMCGAPLPSSPETLKAGERPEATAPRPGAARPVATKPTPSTPPPVRPAQEMTSLHSPSFLGLDQDSPSQSAQYLLEDDDEPSSGRGWILLVLVLVVVVGGLAYRQWKRTGGFSLLSSLRSATQSATNPPQNAGDASPANPAETANAGPSSPSPPASGTGPAPPSPDGTSSPAAAPASAPTEMPATTADRQTPAGGAEPSGSSAEPGTPSPAAPDKNAPARSPKEAAAPALPEDQPHPRAVPAARPAKPTPSRRTAEASTADAGEALLVQGKRYLYGNGVAQNCDLALRSLLAAAEHNNTEALSTLGTMYDTGHCATRDLPAAYRWFAKALHQDPANARISSDLEVIWKEMTPEERRVATKSE